jgi:hypothetical protein
MGLPFRVDQLLKSRSCLPSAGYRFRKFLQRNKGPVLTVSLLLLALVGGIIGTTWGMFRATNEASQKDEALKAAQQSERNAKDQLFGALFHQAHALRSGGSGRPAVRQPQGAGRGRPGFDARGGRLSHPP